MPTMPTSHCASCQDTALQHKRTFCSNCHPHALPVWCYTQRASCQSVLHVTQAGMTHTHLPHITSHTVVSLLLHRACHKCWAGPAALGCPVAYIRVITDTAPTFCLLVLPLVVCFCAIDHVDLPCLVLPRPLASPFGPSSMQSVLQWHKERLRSSSRRQHQQHGAGEHSAAQHGAGRQEGTLVCRDHWRGWTSAISAYKHMQPPTFGY